MAHEPEFVPAAQPFCCSAARCLAAYSFACSEEKGEAGNRDTWRHLPHPKEGGAEHGVLCVRTAH